MQRNATMQLYMWICHAIYICSWRAVCRRPHYNRSASRFGICVRDAHRVTKRVHNRKRMQQRHNIFELMQQKMKKKKTWKKCNNTHSTHIERLAEKKIYQNWYLVCMRNCLFFFFVFLLFLYSTTIVHLVLSHIPRAILCYRVRWRMRHFSSTHCLLSTEGLKVHIWNNGQPFGGHRVKINNAAVSPFSYGSPLWGVANTIQPTIPHILYANHAVDLIRLTHSQPCSLSLVHYMTTFIFYSMFLCAMNPTAILNAKKKTLK